MTVCCSCHKALFGAQVIATTENSPANLPSIHTDAPGDGWVAVVAISQNGVIGRGQTLPWKMSSDLQRFKKLTMGHCLLMGRTTFESIGRPLPGRQTVVLSRSGFRAPAGVNVVRDVADVQSVVDAGRRIMVVGGAQIYALALPRCNTLWLTRVLANIDGDVYFPKLDWSQWQLQSCESLAAGEKDQWPSEFQVWQRRLAPDLHGPLNALNGNRL